MANKRISELNQASSLNGTDEFAVVQSGETKKVSLDTISNQVLANGSNLNNVQADWDETDTNSDAYIKNKPGVEQSDWDETDTNSPAFIKNKPAPVAVPFAGNFDYKGKSTEAAPITISNIGEVTVHERNDGVTELHVSSYDLNGYPYAFYLEASATNQEDNDGIFSNRFVEGSSVTMILTDGIGTQSGGAITGMVKSVKRTGFFIIEFISHSGFNYDNASPNCSLHIESDLSFTRHRAWINDALVDSSIGGGLVFKAWRAQNQIVEPITVTVDSLQLIAASSSVDGHKVSLNPGVGTLTLQNIEQSAGTVYFKNEVEVVENMTLTANVPTTVYFRVLNIAATKTLTIGANVTVVYEYVNDVAQISGGSTQENWCNPALGVVSGAERNLGDQDLTQKSEPRNYDINAQELKFSNGTFNIDSALKITNAGEAEGNILTSDQFGNATWQPIIGTAPNYYDLVNEAPAGYTITTEDSGMLFINSGNPYKALNLNIVGYPLTAFHVQGKIEIHVQAGINLTLPDTSVIGTGHTFICNADKYYIVSRNAFSTSEWEIIEVKNTKEVIPTWVSGGTFYAINDVVNHNGVLYKNLTGTNTATSPDADATNWSLASTDNSMADNDLTLSGNRTHNLNSNNLTFNNGGEFKIGEVGNTVSRFEANTVTGKVLFDGGVQTSKIEADPGQLTIENLNTTANNVARKIFTGPTGNEEYTSQGNGVVKTIDPGQDSSVITTSAEPTSERIHTVGQQKFRVHNAATENTEINMFVNEIDLKMVTSSLTAGLNLDSSDINMYGGSGNFSIGQVTGKNIFTDLSNGKTGIEYAADYSATFVDRSLVDKAYVDAQVGSAADGNFATGDLTFTGNRVHDLGNFALELNNGTIKTGGVFSGTGNGMFEMQVANDSDFFTVYQGTAVNAGGWKLKIKDEGSIPVIEGNSFLTLGAGVTRLLFEDSAQRFRFTHNGNNIALFDANGDSQIDPGTNNLIIGTGTPAAKLSVFGNIQVSDGTQAVGRVLTSDASGVASWQDLPADNNTNFATSNLTLDADRSHALGTFNLGFTGTGKLGVGTATPTARVHVNDKTLYRNQNVGLLLETANYSGIMIEKTGDGYTAMEQTSHGLSFYIKNGVGNGAATDIAMTMDFSRNVGIGTAPDAIDAKLHVEGNTLFASSQAGHYASLRVDVDQDDEAVVLEAFRKDDANNTGRAIVLNNAGGNVGIGVLAPSEKLHINGSARIEDGNQAAGKVLTSDATGKASWEPKVRAAANTGSAITPNVDTEDQSSYTANANTTVNAPTGTAVDGQRHVIRIKDSGTSVTLTWNAAYRAIGVTLPTATTASKLLYVGVIYNAADSKWDVLAINEEA